MSHINDNQENLKKENQELKKSLNEKDNYIKKLVGGGGIFFYYKKCN